MTKLRTKIAVGLVAVVAIGVGDSDRHGGGINGATLGKRPHHDDDAGSAGTGQRRPSRVLRSRHCPRGWGYGQVGSRRRLFDDQPFPAG